MKKTVIFSFFILFCSSFAYAQNETMSDSIFNLSTFKANPFGEFVMDIKMPERTSLPDYSTNMLPSDVTKRYMSFFLIPEHWNISPVIYVSGQPLFRRSLFSPVTELHSATFRINNNVQLRTYGQYTLDGYKIPNRSAYPWERDNFIGGMELKVNKNFEIRMEVRQGRNPMYPY